MQRSGKMNDIELMIQTLKHRLDELEKCLYEDCETGMSKEFIQRRFKFTRQQIGLE